LQIPLRTQSSVEEYITNQEWRDVRLLACPLHPSGGCSFARHGSYKRVTPQGLRIARWYCPQGHRTFSLLPDFLAARLPGLLASIEDTVAAVFSAKSMEAAADALRGLDVTLPSALRWLHRRVRAVQAVLDAVSRVVPHTPIIALARSSMSQIDLGQGHVLLGLRRSLSPRLLNSLPAPLGFQPSQPAGRSRRSHQHDKGPDGRSAAHRVPGDGSAPFGSCEMWKNQRSPSSPLMKPKPRSHWSIVPSFVGLDIFDFSLV
jgi:hypothetical protein